MTEAKRIALQRTNNHLKQAISELRTTSIMAFGLPRSTNREIEPMLRSALESLEAAHEKVLKAMGEDCADQYGR